MTTQRHIRTMPIRRWLALALASMVVVPALTMVVVGFIIFRGTQGPSSSIDETAAILREDVARWNDPTWQKAIGDDLTSLGVDVVLVEDNQEVYRTTADPLAGTDQTSRMVRQLVLSDAEPRRTTIIYSDQEPGPPEELRVWFVPVALLSALCLTLIGTAWFLRRAVVAPLTATSHAAQRVAHGDLDIRLPGSRVREVAELNGAFAAMSNALRASLHQQTAMEEERKLFISAIVHDLRTPLFSLRGSLEGLKQGVADTPERRDRYIAVALDKSVALERLISDLFTFTRLEYLDQTPNRAPLDLATLLADQVNGLRPQAETKRVEVTLAGLPTPCLINGDGHLLTRAIDNLLDNALRHTPAGGTIRIEWKQSSAGAAFSVTDPGPGIANEDLPKLFLPLYRGETSRNRKTGGAGLGLTIARRILVAHGGELTASNGASGGAAFTGFIPHEPANHESLNARQPAG
ncbi:MAG: sensor histidine kinase [Thermomicrobiales bacterium]